MFWVAFLITGGLELVDQDDCFYAVGLISLSVGVGMVGNLKECIGWMNLDLGKANSVIK